MKLGFSPEEELFRQECADWLQGQMAGEFRVVAISADPDAVVLADAAGRLQRHAAGEALAAPDWRVVGVSGGKVVFEQALAVLRVQAGVGDRLDFDALAARARAPSGAAPGKPANGR